MGLEELTKYIPTDQEREINQLIGHAYGFVDLENPDDLPSWPRFRNFLWGNVPALASLEAREKLEVQKVGVEGAGEPLSDAASATRPIVKIPETTAELLDLDSSHILVRSEYEEAE